MSGPLPDAVFGVNFEAFAAIAVPRDPIGLSRFYVSQSTRIHFRAIREPSQG
jgi:hypothetical protein